VPLSIRPTLPSDRPALLELFEKAFKQPADPDEWAWKYDRNPRPSISVVAVDGERALGFFGALGTRYRGAEGDLPGMSAVDVMTHSDWRRLGHRALLTELGLARRRLNAERGVPFVFGFPHDRSRQVLERLLGCRTIEPAGELAAPLLSLVRPGRRRLVRGEPFGRPHAPLAEALHARSGWRTDRSAEVLNWRFSRPKVAYETFQLLDWRGRSKGYAVVRVVLDRALLVDLQVAGEEGGVLPELILGVASALDASTVRRVEVRLPQASRLHARLRDELGFEPFPSDTNLVVESFDPKFDLDRAARAFDYRYVDHDVF